MAPADKIESREAGEQNSAAPPITLPKGGGAVRGIGEKFSSNPVTGTGSMSVPIATSPGRSGFGPQLSLSYDSGSGNGTFGFGWSISLPIISRKTDKGLPRYNDADESDVFILSGAEDLVPELRLDGSRNRDDTTAAGYTIERYRPRIEGQFARIERWTRHKDGDVHWRSISRDNILTLYGKDTDSRIADPEDPTRIFTWLICETRDDKGNAVLYGFKRENGDGVILTRVCERNRGDSNDVRRNANRYLKTIRYGNDIPLLNSNGHRPRFLADLPAAQIQNVGWMFEVVFDYGEHNADAPSPNDPGLWIRRDDPFSSYRSGFEVRTTRLCNRVLMFHHIPDLPTGEQGYDGLVRSTDLTYSHGMDPASARNPIYTFLRAVTQTGYKRGGVGYLKRCMPPVEFEYSVPIVQDAVEDIDPADLENLPIGVDGTSYQWVDLHGEGIPGILAEQADGWFYKRNISPVSKRRVELAPTERVASKPNLELTSGHAQFMDLAGDGQPDLVVLDGAMPGLFEHDEDEGWQRFRAFTSRLNRDMRDPNLRLVDLDGDGHADVLITEEDAFVWHVSLAESGFGMARRVAQALDEEKGPRLVFADATQSIYLADISGDGLTDLVRIRNGEVCYWPNLGYCRFGDKVSMDNAPHFDNPDQFDHKRVRLADIDGSGTSDIIYLHREGVRIYFNQSGNGWSAPQQLRVFPRADDLASIVPTDLFGNGTACLVWSSPLIGDARRPMRYVNLMGGQKPHLLIKSANNLGAETHMQYAPSTKFYLRDKLAGKPWITKLPFPVHCVEKVTVTDKWRKTSFSSTYSYHHGYFDGTDREFRGFGRVETVDVESYGEFENSNGTSPYIAEDKTLYQPPVRTTTWYHTGAFLDRARILAQFEREYFPRWLEDSHPGIHIAFQENTLPQPDLESENLSAEEWREALRACKGMMLRQEVVELDIDALERPVDPAQLPTKLFSTAYHNCHIRRLQPKNANRHAVFLVAESEAITYHYELDIREAQLPTLNPDPRIAHTLNLRFDEYANVLQSVAAFYPRLGKFEDDANLADGLADALPLIRQVQREVTHLAYSETRYTKDFRAVLTDPFAALDNHRLRLPCETLTYELTGIGPADADDITSTDPRDNLYFTIDELRAFRLSQVLQDSGTLVQDIPYHQISNRTTPEKRLVAHARTLFFADNLVDPLPFGEHGRLGLTFESYKLALTAPLLDAVFKDAGAINKIDQAVDGATTARAKLDDSAISGYLSGAKLMTRFASIPAIELMGQYWIRSGIAGFANDAAQHFYVPERYTDPFDKFTALQYDPRDLYVKSSTDAMGNTTVVSRFDFRVLAPSEMKDINDNLSEVFFDVLGQATAMVLKGKGTEGDNLNGFTDAMANPELSEVTAFFIDAPFNELRARNWLANATVRHVHYFGETLSADGTITWAMHPACACAVLREQHVAELAPGEHSPLQTSFEYSDGAGNVVVKKIQGAPVKAGQPVRWIANGKTILNNKGKPVKQYEPYFSSSGHRFEDPEEEGVTPLIYYDALGRTVRTEMPDGSFRRVEFSPWYVRTFDQNDTVKEPGNAWFASKTATTASTEEMRAAQLAAEHADTPSLAILDSLGRDVISVAHNRVKAATGVLTDEKYLTFTKLDAEGKALWVRDARKNRVMQFIVPPVPNNQAADPVMGFTPSYDIAGNLLYQNSMDAGDRWMLNDASGKPMLAWDSRGHIFRTDYDALHRPVGSFVKGADPADVNHEIQFEKVIHGDAPGIGLTDGERVQLNLRGKPYQHYDTAGLVISRAHNPVTGTDEAFDFKGNPLRSTRQLVADYKGTPDWLQNPVFEGETFSSSTRFDALNRPIQLVAPHSNRAEAKFNVIRPSYNEANLLQRMDVWLEQSAEPATLLIPTTANLKSVTNINYDAKGQRNRIEYNEASHTIITEYTYDKDTFRLTRLLTTRPKHPESDRRVLQDLSYTYDPVGNITHIRDEAQQTVFFNNATIDPNNQYSYDPLYRLIRAEGREHTAQNNVQRDAINFAPTTSIPFSNSPEALQRYVEDYQYDAVGNVLGMHHTSGGTERWVRWYQYALDSNRLLATRLPGDASKRPFYVAAPGYSATYTYDVHGNMTTMPHLPTMVWDFKDQLGASQQQIVNTGAGEKTYYVYDSSGQRVRKVTETHNSEPKDERIYLGGIEVYRKYNGNAQTIKLERETLHVMDGKQRVMLVETRTQQTAIDPAPRQSVRFQLGNHLGSAALELDDQALVVSYEEYHPYGSTSYQATRNQTETPKRYRFTGKERDEETGFSYHGARYCAGWLGRWICCDPIKIRGGINLYAYAASNPIRLTDPSGHQPAPPPQGTLMGLWEYGKNLANRAALGTNVQLDHPIQVAGRIAQRTSDAKVGFYSRAISKAESELTVIVETGKGLFHTELGKLQAPIREAMKSGALSSESEIVALTKAAYARASTITGAVVDELALDTAILSNQATIHTSLASTVEELKVIGTGATTIGNVGADVDRAFEAAAQLAPKAAEAAAIASKAAPALSKFAQVAEALAPAGRFLGKVAGPLGIGIGVVQVATAKNTEGQIDGGITALSSALMMSPHPVAKAAGGGLMAGQIIEKTLDVSKYASDHGMTVYEGLKSLGANDTASLVVGGAVTVLSTPVAIGEAAVDKSVGLAKRAYHGIFD